jgi:ankyrin repeat protein
LVHEKKVDVNKLDMFGRTPLMTACLSQNIDAVDVILDRSDLDIGLMSMGGETVLMKAVQAPNQDQSVHMKILELLITKGKADAGQVNQNNGWTALKYAKTYNPSPNVIEHL